MKSLRLLLRFLTIGGLVLLLLIPLLMIRGTIQDRERYRAQAVQRVSQSMAGPQQVVGPLRVVPWKETRRVNAVKPDGTPELRHEVEEGYVFQAPTTLAVEGGLQPGQRRIGLYEVRVFEWKAAMKASFEPMALTEVAGRTYGQPYIALGLADVRGLVGTPTLKVDGVARAMVAGTGAMSGRMDGLHAVLEDTGMQLPASAAQLTMTLAGTQSLGIAPVADSNDIALHSAWPHPLFGGRFLPNQRTVDGSGFTARWEISSLASAAQSQLETGVSGKLTRPQTRVSSSEASLDEDGAAIDSVVVSLVDPVDVYTQADRASKYGILFVVLTFVGFALFELIKRLPIHPLQYLLVGLALAIFFLLLLSLSEHISFWKSYVLSATACIGLQFVYLSGVLKSWLRAAGFATMLTTLYGVLYGLLVSEDNALLMGSLLLFGILAAIMWVTRKMDWYALSTELR
ncbi:cell envelope integrity protein CreD [Pseudoxanthomonas sp. SL93]|uniref:cell envelope integrity protein CreD n=1 Tax=Pseudoxanthomonas sp. SL93 TaxID=2995142 RepID=UPI00226E3D11|nr:cell envelope integrity protein CreD [Pseudoxanthomonas sp. SL93]WAC64528.1 cell envelope integrity protein CreD [Pseudoxanthomonas sp. SL93]